MITMTSRLDLLVLARLATPRPPKLADLVKTLGPLAAPDATGAAWRATLTARLDALATAGAITRRPLQLTDAGRERLRTELGLPRTPSWKDVQDRHLPALGLGLRPGTEHERRAFADAERLQSELLARQLGVNPAPSLNALIDAVIATELGLPPGRLTLEKIRAHLLARRIGTSAKGKAVEIAARAVATSVRAPNAKLNTLRSSLARRWLADGGGNGKAPPAPKPFVKVVRDAIAKVPPAGRFGKHKVFVSALWRQLDDGAELGGMTLDEFKRHLLSANQEGALSLARADLVGAMDPGEVAISEISDLGSTFHFVLDATRR